MATVISTMVMASAWSVYMMVWRWWAETGPRIETERAARLALLNVTDGVTSIKNLSGNVADSYSIGSTPSPYKCRNGIAWSTLTKEDLDSNPSFTTPVISADGHQIDFKLDRDAVAVNGRSFYAGTYDGQGVVYYKHTNGTSYMLDSTRGITDLKFEKFEDAQHVIHDDIIKVTVTAEKEIHGTRAQQSYTVGVVYADTVYLRNAL